MIAKGFYEQEGIDFEDTINPIVKPPTIRLILPWQFDSLAYQTVVC